MKKLLLICLCAVSVCLAAAIKNPFTMEAAAFYFVHKGGPLQLSINFETKSEKSGCPGHLRSQGGYVARIFDANENLVAWSYNLVTKDGPNGISHTFGQAAPAGIYQIRYSGQNILATVKATPETPFGVMPMRCAIYATSTEQFADTYLFIPPNAETLSLRPYACSYEIFDEQNQPIKIEKDFNLKKYRNQVWNVKTKGIKGISALYADGIPFILCPDVQTAKAIKGSVEVTKDGKYFAHKFQIKMYNWVNQVKEEDLKVTTVPIKSLLPKMEKDPVAKGLLGSWGLFNYINSIINIQDINPQSKNFTAFLWKGGEPMNYTPALSAVLGMNKPYNPYYQNPAIEKRVLVNSFKHFMNMKESDTWSDSSSNYCGSDGLSFAWAIGTYYNAGRAIKDKAALALWTDGIRRHVDRWSMFRVSCDNQSSHWPYSFLCVYQVTNLEAYRNMALEYLYGMSREGGDRFMQTGYQQEAYGPDGTYQGLGACYQAICYRWTNYPIAKNTLKNIYTLYNHSLAPETDGHILGTDGYGFRTRGTWANRQYGGGTAFMKGVLPEAAVWGYNKEFDKPIAQLVKESAAHPGSAAKYGASVISPYYSEFLLPSDTIKNAKFPVEESDNFTRNFNNEFVAVRKPKFYTFSYLGMNPGAAWTRASSPKVPANNTPSGKWGKYQGLGLLWFPNFGSVLTSMNWNGNTGYMLRADLANGECAYPDYWNAKATFLDDTKEAYSVATDLFNFKGINFQRSTKHLDNGVAVELIVNFTEDVNVVDLYEQLPLTNYKKRNFDLHADPNGKTDSITIDDAVTIKLDAPHKCDFGPDTTLFSQPIHPLRIHLGNNFKKGTSIKLAYRITK